MRGKAYALMRYKDIQAISLSKNNAQEILTDYALEDGYYTFIYDFNFLALPLKDSIESANEIMEQWRIWEYNLV